MTRYVLISPAMVNYIAAVIVKLFSTEGKAVYFYPRMLNNKNSGGKLIHRYSYPTIDDEYQNYENKYKMIYHHA